MIRTQIQLTETQAVALRRVARDQGVSMAALLRRGADLVIAAPGEGRRHRAMGVIGAFSSGRQDVSRSHDEHLADAFGA